MTTPVLQITIIRNKDGTYSLSGVYLEKTKPPILLGRNEKSFSKATLVLESLITELRHNPL